MIQIIDIFIVMADKAEETINFKTLVLVLSQSIEFSEMDQKKRPVYARDIKQKLI